MKILIAEDESDISHTYRVALESRNHDVEITDDGVKCVQIYREKLSKRQASSNKNMKPNSNLRNSRPTDATPFDVVVLDYKMPRKDGMEVTKEILTLNPDQRIIFASAYVKETLENSVKELKRVVELMQKPFEIQVFVDTIEDKQVYEELKKIMINIRTMDDDNASSEHEPSDSSRKRMRDLFECLRKIQKNRTF